MQSQFTWRDFRPHVDCFQTQSAAGGLNVRARRELLKREQFERIVTTIDRALHHLQKWIVQHSRRVIQMNLAQTKSRQHRAPLATEFKRKFGISIAGELDT